MSGTATNSIRFGIQSPLDGFRTFCTDVADSQYGIAALATATLVVLGSMAGLRYTDRISKLPAGLLSATAVVICGTVAGTGRLAQGVLMKNT